MIETQQRSTGEFDTRLERFEKERRSTLVERLRGVATGDQSALDIFHAKDWRPGTLAMLLWEGAAEIERLRALAGAVSQGDGSFRDIAKDLPRSDPSKHQV